MLKQQQTQLKQRVLKQYLLLKVQQVLQSQQSSENTRGTTSATTNESQAPTETATVEAQAVSTRDSATSETATTIPVINEDVNVTGGQYYSDQNGNWHYRDTNGNDLTGPQTIDGVQVYFDKENGIQAKGVFAKDPNDTKKLNFYDKDSGDLLKVNLSSLQQR